MTNRRAAAPPAPGCAPPPRAPRRRPPDSMSGSAPRQWAVGRQRPEREVRAIAVVLQIERPRKAGRREARVAPQPISLLRAHQELGAAPHGVPLGLARGD